MTTEQMKVKVALTEAMQMWLNDTDLSLAFDTYLPASVSMLMGDAAFNVLIAMEDLTDYLKGEDLLKD